MFGNRRDSSLVPKTDTDALARRLFNMWLFAGWSPWKVKMWATSAQTKFKYVRDSSCVKPRTAALTKT